MFLYPRVNVSHTANRCQYIVVSQVFIDIMAMASFSGSDRKNATIIQSADEFVPDATARIRPQTRRLVSKSQSHDEQAEVIGKHRYVRNEAVWAKAVAQMVLRYHTLAFDVFSACKTMLCRPRARYSVALR